MALSKKKWSVDQWGNSVSSTDPITTTLVIPATKNQKQFHDQNFLHRKYTVEGLSSKRIARQIFSSRQSVIKYLRRFGIPLRPEDQQPKGMIAFGQMWLDTRTVESPADQRVIQRMIDLRAKGVSYERIADQLNRDGIPTKIGKARWWGMTVRGIIARQEDRVVKNM